MRARWEELRAALVHSMTTLRANRQFQDAGSAHAPLARFSGSDALVAYLTEKGGDLDEKDAIYAALVGAVQSGVAWAQLAQALLWIGLWPGLDAVYRRRLRHFVENPEDLVGEVSFAFATLVERIDLLGVRRLAATLVRNVDRDVGEQLRRRWAEAARRQQLDEDDEAFVDPASESQRAADMPLPCDADDLAALRAWLASIVGDDADLVIGVAIDDLSQREIAERAGLHHDATRKRIQRALKKIRERPQREKEACPSSPPRTAFPIRTDREARA